MPPTLAERLGYAPDARLLIFNCDDLGSCRSANVAIYEALRDGLATSATLMVPCPWARDAAAMYRGEDVGVHLTLNSEWSNYRWGPITHSPSLLDGDGGFPRTVEDVWDHADLDEVRKECRAQVERAIYWGFDVTHLDSHMGTMQLRPPSSTCTSRPRSTSGSRCAWRRRRRATDRLPVPAGRRARGHRVPRPLRLHERRLRLQIEAALGSLSPGVTEIYVHPGGRQRRAALVASRLGDAASTTTRSSRPTNPSPI